MTKGELIEALRPFTDEIEINRAVANKYGEETFEISITKVNYIFGKGDKVARIVLK